jgi:hypothetical protein
MKIVYLRMLSAAPVRLVNLWAALIRFNLDGGGAN